jgi:hypothetical protein
MTNTNLPTVAEFETAKIHLAVLKAIMNDNSTVETPEGTEHHTVAKYLATIKDIVHGYQTVTTPDGAEIKSIGQYLNEMRAAIASAGFESLGTWQNGVTTFDDFDQVAYYAGVPYKVKPSTTLPYVAQSASPTTTPDSDNVAPLVDNQSYVFTTLDNLKAGLSKNGQLVSGLLSDGSKASLTESGRHGDFVCRAYDDYTDEISLDTECGKYVPVDGELWVWVRETQLTFESFGASNTLADCHPAFASAAALGETVVNGGSSSYCFESLVFDLASNTKFDLGGAEVIWNGVNENSSSSSRINGVFNARGVTEATFSFGVNIDPEESKNTIGLNVVHAWMQPGVWIYLSTPYNSSSPTNRYSQLMQITEIGNYEIKVNVNLKYAFSGSASIGRVAPLHGIEIKNFYITDNMSTDGNNAICGVNVMRCVKPLVSGVDFDGMYNPVVTAYSCFAPVVQDGEGKNAKDTTGGRGYYVQFGDCYYPLAQRLYLTNGRHLVDFTACGYGNVSDCHGVDNSEPDFSMHGQYEHDIVIEDSTGSIGVAISGDSFGSYAEDVTARNVKGDNFFNYMKAKNVTLEDCDFKIWSTNCKNFVARNSKATNYARISGSVGESAKIYGGFIKSESYNGANFCNAPAGVIEFFGSRVESIRDSSAYINMDYFTMHGGVFSGGFMTPKFKGQWLFNGTTFDATTFELNNNVYGGSVLTIEEPKLINPINTGLIRNRIPASGIRIPTGDESQSVDERFTVQITGGYLDPVTAEYKNLDFDQPSQCLNVLLDRVNLISGTFVCDMRFPSTYVGDLDVNLGYVSDDVSGAPLLITDYRHYYNLSDLDDEFGLPSGNGKKHDRITRTVFRVGQSASSGFLSYNYPINDQPKGLLIVEYDATKSFYIQTMYYIYSGKAYNGHVYRRMHNGTEWSSWSQI